VTAGGFPGHLEYDPNGEADVVEELGQGDGGVAAVGDVWGSPAARPLPFPPRPLRWTVSSLASAAMTLPPCPPEHPPSGAAAPVVFTPTLYDPGFT
jgi:hypothetical protein